MGKWKWAGEAGGSRKKFRGGKGRENGRVRLLKWFGGARKGSRWLCYAGPLAGRSGISGNRRRPKPTLWKRNSWKSLRERRASDRTNERVHRFSVRFGRERRASHMPCLSFGKDRQSTSGSGDVSPLIFITSVSGRESLTSFTNRIFHFSGPRGFRMAFDATEMNGRFGRI